MSAPEIRYFAFLSYSHRDAPWARWLHRGLESYRLPTGIARRDGSSPETKLAPVFRDRDELPAAGDLSSTIREALGQSRFLIVLCSPASAASRYVSAEITHFRALGGGERIFALIVDGDPPACFPPALLETGAEPVAADARPVGDGKGDAKLKLIAGLLGVGFDALKRRELRRQRNRFAALTATVAAIAIAMAALAWDASSARAQAEAREKEAVAARGEAEFAKGEAEEAEEETRATLARSRFVQSATALEAGDAAGALALLARAVADDAGARLARIRLHSLLSTLNHAVPVASFQTRESVVALPPGFHPDGSLFFDGERIWELPGLELAAPGFDSRWNRSPHIGLADPAMPLVRVPSLLNVAKIVSGGDLLTPIVTLEHDDTINTMLFSPDGRRAATASDDGTAVLWRIPSGERIGPPLTHGGKVTSAVFSPDGELLLTTSTDGHARLWNGHDASPISEPFEHPGRVDGAVFSEEVDRFATWNSSGEVRVWFLGDTEPTATISAHGDQITDARFAPGGGMLATASHDHTVRIWDSESYASTGDGPSLFPAIDLSAPALRVAFSADGRLLAIACADRSTRIYELVLHPPPPESAPYSRSVSSPSGRVTVELSFERAVFMREDGDSFDVEMPSPRIGQEMGIVFSPDESLCVTLHADRAARVWDLGARGKLVATVVPPGTADLKQVVFSHDGSAFVLVSDEIRLFDPRTATELRGPLQPNVDGVFTGSAWRAALSPDGTMLAGVFGLEFQRWKFPSGEAIGAPIVWTTGIGGSPAIAFSQSGDRIVTGGFLNGIRVWDAATGLPASNPMAGGSDYRYLLLRDDLLAAISSPYPELEIWHPETRQRVAGPIGLGESVPTRLTFGTSGRSVRIRDAGGNWSEITFDPGEMAGDALAAANAIAGRSIDPRTGVALPGIPWAALAEIVGTPPEERPRPLDRLTFPVLGEWSFEHWIDGQLPTTHPSEGIELLQRFPQDPLVNAGMAAYFATTDAPGSAGDKMRDLAPGCAQMANLNLNYHPLVNYWLARYYEAVGDGERARRSASMALAKSPADRRFRDLVDELGAPP